MDDQTNGVIEARSRELGLALLSRLDEYRPSLKERLQDRLMLLLMEDHTLRTRLLRYIDVLAAFPESGSSNRTASLFREFFRADFSRIPSVLRWSLALARSPLVPEPLLAGVSRQSMRWIASRFIVPSGANTVNHMIDRLSRQDRRPSFDLLGEAVVSEVEADQYRRDYLDLLQRLGNHPQAQRRTAGDGPCLEVSLKLSSLTAHFNPADPVGTLRRVRPRLEEICAAARQWGLGVTVDAEQYAYRELVWYILTQVLAHGESLGAWPDAGMVVQGYLRDSEDHAREVLEFAQRRETPLRVRLVKGAYWDYEAISAAQYGWPTPVYLDKGATDLNYRRITRLLLSEFSPVRLALGSHNIQAHAYGEAVRESLGLPESAIEHQTLYQTLESLSRALPGMGWVSRDYVPVGQLIPGMAYLVRRVLENTSQVGFLTRARFDGTEGDLLRPPEPGDEDRSYQKPAFPFGFENTPLVRLFDAKERDDFAAALEQTRSGWSATYPLHIGTEEVDTSTVVPSFSPSHSDPATPVGWVHQATLVEAERAIKVANEALPDWAGRSVADRAAIGLHASEILQQRKNKLAAWVVHEGARTWAEALADVEEAIDHVAWAAREAQRQTDSIETHFQPRGVVACIPPWNFPSALPAAMTSGALMAGNTVILKSAEQTPIVAEMLVRAFHDAGVPMEALIHLPGPGETIGDHLVRSPDVDMVAFTGSRAVGTSIYRVAAAVTPRKGGIKRVVTEMGGKNAIVVFPDADLDEAALGILQSAFSHAGQKCSACSRVLVHQEIYSRLVPRLVEAARSLPVGPADSPDTVINPLIDAAAWKRVWSEGESTKAEWKVLLDARETTGQPENCLGPLIVEVPLASAHEARITCEEIFGPVLPLVPFETEEQAVSLVNDTDYGLTLGIFSRSPATINRMVRACIAGNIYVNREITGARVGIEPFGGLQLSGTGPKTGGAEYLQVFLTRRNGFRLGTKSTSSTTATDGSRAYLPALVPWDQERVSRRLECLSNVRERLEHHDEDLGLLLAPCNGSRASARSRQLRRKASAVLDSVGEIAAPQPTLEVPGQTNLVRWDLPRGTGVIAADNGADPADLVALVFAALLAGNGVVVAAPERWSPFTDWLSEQLHRSGVPEKALTLAPANTVPERLVSGPIHFAAVDLDLERTLTLYGVLGITRQEEGQRWLKALISLADGLRPGDPGFLRQFALPRTVAVRTLRHGAELELL